MLILVVRMLNYIDVENSTLLSPLNQSLCVLRLRKFIQYNTLDLIKFEKKTKIKVYSVS